ncbi:MAG: hypothetical protein ACRDYU_16420 [Actinomycetes bacterium]
MRIVLLVLGFVLLLAIVADFGNAFGGLDSLPRADESNGRVCGLVMMSDDPGVDRAVERGVIPELDGVNLDLAEQILRVSGFENVIEEDATERDRDITVDDNWFVVRQFPPAGTIGPPDTGVVLTVNTYGEDEDKCPSGWYPTQAGD